MKTTKIILNQKMKNKATKYKKYKKLKNKTDKKKIKNLNKTNKKSRNNKKNSEININSPNLYNLYKIFAYINLSFPIKIELFLRIIINMFFLKYEIYKNIIISYIEF